MDELVNAVVTGGPAGWADRPCSRCGAPARFPAGLVAGTKLEALGALCDECEGDDVHEMLEQMVDELHDPAELIAASGIADHPEVELHRIVDEWLGSDETAGLFLVGNLGVGKTYQACQLVRHWCRTRRRPALYVTEVELHERLQDWDTRRAFRDRVKSIPLLVVDDIGTAKASQFKASDVYDVIDHRDQHARNSAGEVLLRTVFISNHSPGVLTQLPTIDQRVLIRIERMCGGAAKRLTKTWEEPIS